MQNDTQPILAAIVAMSTNRIIGAHNRLPWHLPADLKHFKAITTGHPIIMGKKTYLSIGKPLPNRTNIILTRDPRFEAPGCFIATSIADACAAAKQHASSEIFIIGGADIFQQTLPYLQRIYLTLIHHTFEGDTYFPEINQNEWQTHSQEEHLANADNPYHYSFLILNRCQAHHDPSTR